MELKVIWILCRVWQKLSKSKSSDFFPITMYDGPHNLLEQSQTYSIWSDTRRCVGTARAIRLCPTLIALASATLAASIASAHNTQIAVTRLVVALAVFTRDAWRVITLTLATIAAALIATHSLGPVQKFLIGIYARRDVARAGCLASVQIILWLATLTLIAVIKRIALTDSATWPLS